MAIVTDSPTARDELELLARARQGDADAFCLVAQAHQTRLFRQAAALCRDESTAEDLVVETMAEAWKSLSRYHGGCRFSTWLYSILLHRYQRHRSRAVRQPVSWSQWSCSADGQQLETMADAAEEPSNPMAREDLTRSLKAALDRLSDTHRQVILLRFYEEATLAEIAAALRCSVGTVKSRLHHALEKLRRMRLIVNLSDLGRDP